MRKYVDCREFPTDRPCSLRIEGTEEEILSVAIPHAVDRHGHQDTPELRRQIQSMLKPVTETARAR